MGAGRPDKLNDANLELIQYMYENGATDQQVADQIGVARQTLCNWRKDNRQFFDAIKRYKEFSDSEVEASLYDKARGAVVVEEKTLDENGNIVKITQRQVPPSDTSIIFWLKNRQPEKYRDKVEHKHEFSLEKLVGESFKDEQQEAISTDIEE